MEQRQGLGGVGGPGAGRGTDATLLGKQAGPDMGEEELDDNRSSTMDGPEAAAPSEEATRRDVMLLCSLQVLTNFFFCGCIFGYASLQLLLREDGVFAKLCPGLEEGGCPEQLSAFLLVYTLGSSCQVFSSFPVGFMVDALGPVSCTGVGGSLVVAGLLLFGLADPDSLAAFSMASILLSVGGTVLFITSFLLGFIVSPRRTPLLMTLINCAFDGSTCIFLFFYLVIHYSQSEKITRRSVFIGFALIGVVVIASLMYLWAVAGAPILARRKLETCSRQQQHQQQQALELDCVVVIESETRTSYAAVDKEADVARENHTDFHKLRWYEQLYSRRFVCLALFGSTHLFRANALMGIIHDKLTALGDARTGFLVNTLYSAILPLGGLFAPVIDWIIYNNSFTTTMNICTALGSVYGGLVLVPFLLPQIAMAIVFTLFRALFYACVGTYSVQLFGPVNAGRTYGTVWVFGGALNLLVWPALIITNEYAGGDFMPFDSFLLALCLPIFLTTTFILRPALLSVKGASWPTK